MPATGISNICSEGVLCLGCMGNKEQKYVALSEIYDLMTQVVY